MKKIIFISFATLFIISCSNNDSIDLTVYNSELSIVQNLENGVLANTPFSKFWTIDSSEL